MKKTIKTLAIMAALAVFGTVGLFAQEDEVMDVTTVEIPAEFENVKTIAATVKVANKNGVTTIYLKLKDGKTYIADALGPSGDEAIKTLLKRNKKKAVVSGFLNEKTGVFNVIKIGSLKNIIGGDEK